MMFYKHTEIHVFVFLKMKIFNCTEKHTLFALCCSIRLIEFEDSVFAIDIKNVQKNDPDMSDIKNFWL